VRIQSNRPLCVVFLCDPTCKERSSDGYHSRGIQTHRHYSLCAALQIRRVTESTGCGMATLGTWLPRHPKGHHGIHVLTSAPSKDTQHAGTPGAHWEDVVVLHGRWVCLQHTLGRVLHFARPPFTCGVAGCWSLLPTLTAKPLTLHHIQLMCGYQVGGLGSVRSGRREQSGLGWWPLQPPHWRVHFLNTRCAPHPVRGCPPPPHHTTDYEEERTISSKRTAIEDWEGGLELRQSTSTSPSQGDRPTAPATGPPTHPHTPRAVVGTCWDTVLLFHPRTAVYTHSRVAESVWVGPGTRAAHTPWWERGWGDGWQRSPHPHTHPGAGAGTCWDTAPLFQPRPAVYIHSRVAESMWVGPGTRATHRPRWERGWGGGWLRLQPSPPHTTPRRWSGHMLGHSTPVSPSHRSLYT
jgi:hypothetical protein